MILSDKRIGQLFLSVEKIFKVVSSNDSQMILDALNSCSPDDLTAVMYARNFQNYTVLQMAMALSNLDGVGKIIDFRMKKLKQNPWQPGAKLEELIQHSKATRLLLNRLEKYCPTKENLPYDLCFKKIVKNLLSECVENHVVEDYKEQRDPSLTDQPLLIILEESLEFFGSSETPEFVENIRNGMMLWKGVGFVVSMLKMCILAPIQLFMKSVYTSELLDAAKRNDFASVKICVTGHPNINQEDTDYYTPLRHAFKHGNIEMAKTLLRLGADPTIESPRHEEPLLRFALCCMMESKNRIDAEIVQLIFDRVSDDKLHDFLNAKSWKNDFTAIDWADGNHEFLLTLLLLSKGANYSRINSYRAEKLVNFANQSFNQARNGQVKELIKAMKKLDELSLLAIAGTRNEQDQTLQQVLEVKGHVDEVEQIRKLISSERAEYCKRNADEFLRGNTRVVLSVPYRMGFF